MLPLLLSPAIQSWATSLALPVLLEAAMLECNWSCMKQIVHVEPLLINTSFPLSSYEVHFHHEYSNPGCFAANKDLDYHLDFHVSHESSLILSLQWTNFVFIVPESQHQIQAELTNIACFSLLVENISLAFCIHVMFSCACLAIDTRTVIAICITEIFLSMLG